MFVKARPGTDVDTVQKRLDGLIKREFPAAEVLNQRELKKSQENHINQLLGLVYALLSLAVIGLCVGGVLAFSGRRYGLAILPTGCATAKRGGPARQVARAANGSGL